MSRRMRTGTSPTSSTSRTGSWPTTGLSQGSDFRFRDDDLHGQLAGHGVVPVVPGHCVSQSLQLRSTRLSRCVSVSTVTVSSTGNQAYRLQWLNGANTQVNENVYTVSGSGVVTFTDTFAPATQAKLDRSRVWKRVVQWKQPARLEAIFGWEGCDDDNGSCTAGPFTYNGGAHTPVLSNCDRAEWSQSVAGGRLQQQRQRGDSDG